MGVPQRMLAVLQGSPDSFELAHFLGVGVTFASHRFAIESLTAARTKTIPAFE
jgi:hypothetical protein